MGKSRGLGLEKLSAAQVETLQHVFAHRSSKEIARIMGVSPHTVDERLRRAIRLLGVQSRIEAARLVAGNTSPSAYQPLIYQPSELAHGSVAPDEETALSGMGQTGAFSIGYPFPTNARPINTHGLRERIIWPILIAFGTIMAFAALYAVLLGLGAMLT
ncbi:helix-turn-helix transcriptional regulator [Sphingorhabdus sp.]|uniref:response regulator transcription factor n=1 Tax=Sphingorhabdus sp. TaxID=1902408 RepID=UPI0032B8527C